MSTNLREYGVMVVASDGRSLVYPTHTSSVPTTVPEASGDQYTTVFPAPVTSTETDCAAAVGRCTVCQGLSLNLHVRLSIKVATHSSDVDAIRGHGGRSRDEGRGSLCMHLCRESRQEKRDGPSRRHQGRSW